MRGRILVGDKAGVASLASLTPKSFRGRQGALKNMKHTPWKARPHPAPLARSHFWEEKIDLTKEKATFAPFWLFQAEFWTRQLVLGRCSLEQESDLSAGEGLWGHLSPRVGVSARGG